MQLCGCHCVKSNCSLKALTPLFFFKSGNSTYANYTKAMSHTECFGFIKTTCKRLLFLKLNPLLIILEMFTPLHRETAHECLIDITVAAKFLHLSWQGHDSCLLIRSSRSLSVRNNKRFSLSIPLEPMNFKCTVYMENNLEPLNMTVVFNTFCQPLWSKLEYLDNRLLLDFVQTFLFPRV